MPTRRLILRSRYDKALGAEMDRGYGVMGVEETMVNPTWACQLDLRGGIHSAVRRVRADQSAPSRRVKRQDRGRTV